MTLRQSVHHLLEGAPTSRTTRLVRAALAALILLNVAAVVLETVPSVHARAPDLFTAFERISIAIFSLEYLLRLWCAVEDVRFRAPVRGRLRWALTPAALVDLLAVLPGYLPTGAFDLRTLRLLRLVRIVRLAKLGRYSVAVQTLQNVLRSKAADLLSLLMLLFALLIVTSTLMFFLEHEAQPDAF
ncbi:MAG: ion transporter, partial [Planctomycetota bacterium]